MMKKILSKREKKILLITIVLFAVLFIKNYAIKPLCDNINGLDIKISESKKRIINQKKTINEAKNIIESNPEFFLENRIGDIIEIKKIKDYSNQCMSEIGNINKYPATSEKGLNKSEIKLNLSTKNLKEVTRFLYLIQKKPDFYSISGMKIESDIKNDGFLKIDFILTKFSPDKSFIVDSKKILDFEKNSNIHQQENLIAEDIKSYEYYTKEMSNEILGSIVQIDFKDDNIIDLSKKIKLIGIVLDSNPKVIMEDLELGQTFLVSKGETIKDAVLKDILKDRVKLFYDGKIFELSP